MSPDDLLDRGVAKSADQLVFQVGGAPIEAKRLHIGAGHPEAEPGPLDSAPETAFRTGVTQASYHLDDAAGAVGEGQSRGLSRPVR